MEIKLRSIERSYDLDPVDPADLNVFYIDRPDDRLIAPPQSFFHESGKIDDHFWIFQLRPQKFKIASIYIAQIKDCFVLPSGIVVLRDGSLLVESLYPSVPKDYLEGNAISRRAPDVNGLQAIRANDLSQIETIESAIHCREHGEVGYFHWLASALPRASLVTGSFAGPPSPFMMRSNPGFTDAWADIVLQDRLRRQPASQPVFVRNLIFPSPAQVGSAHYTRNPALLKMFRRHLAQAGLLKPRENKPTRRIYISRNDAPVRRVLNEDELCKALQKFRFEKHTLAGLPVQEQVDLFSSAEIVIGAHGAGLTNIMFCQSGSSAIELMPKTRTWPGFKFISNACDVGYSGYVADRVDEEQSKTKGVGNEDFSVDVNSFVRFMEATRTL